MTCSLCSLPIPPSLPGSSQLGATVDHINPRASGGSRRAPANQARAHRICNSLKGSAVVTPELRAAMVAAVQKRMRVYLLSLSRESRAVFVAEYSTEARI